MCLLRALHSNGTTGVLSNFMPLWAGCYPNGTKLDSVVNALSTPRRLFPARARRLLADVRLCSTHRVSRASLAVTSELIKPGGLATTKKSFFNNQQWDWPNAWAPLQQMVIEGLENVGTTESAHGSCVARRPPSLT